MKKVSQCLSCGYLINPDEGYQFCNCSARKPSKEKFYPTEQDKIKGAGEE